MYAPHQHDHEAPRAKLISRDESQIQSTRKQSKKKQKSSWLGKQVRAAAAEKNTVR